MRHHSTKIHLKSTFPISQIRNNIHHKCALLEKGQGCASFCGDEALQQAFEFSSAQLILQCPSLISNLQRYTRTI
jgi:hypothetical protein